ncbi:hypothetical protein RBG61_01940 [Paludicola sp. MB14-C6]|uniref:Gp37-like protein n=1 Tax=Paludihabitans sp. MB14-C6 TaxID=3070656 RepID=UPI0027DDE74C|nr:hypothetical protein [Paludicola sp. MB14-C6]WMJ23452.1 hypothetical protein RBG61_01940 [Paludicola sp. MB14-C6]
MAIIFLYKDLAEGETFALNQLKATNKAFNIRFTEHDCDVGTFEFSLPADDLFCSRMQKNYIIGIDNTFFGIIRQAKQVIQGNQNYVVVSGVDLKGYTQQRITVYPASAITSGLQGYDAINNAYTETVVKYFINNNLINPRNSKRKIIGFENAPDLHRGLANDKYMSRFESLSEVCNKNLSVQNMGYRVNIDLANSKLLFDVSVGKNRTANQSENNRVIFDVKYKNLIDMEYFFSVQDYKNIFYSTLSKARNEQEALTCMYYRDGEEEPIGSQRFEEHLNVSVNLPDADIYTYMKEYALKDASKYEMVETLTASVADRYKYGIDYNLGDFVTVQARTGLFNQKLAQLDVQIKSITHTWTDTRIVRTLGFGNGKLSKFDILKRQIRNGGF